MVLLVSWVSESQFFLYYDLQARWGEKVKSQVVKFPLYQVSQEREWVKSFPNLGRKQARTHRGHVGEASQGSTQSPPTVLHSPDTMLGKRGRGHEDFPATPLEVSVFHKVPGLWKTSEFLIKSPLILLKALLVWRREKTESSEECALAVRTTCGHLWEKVPQR